VKKVLQPGAPMLQPMAGAPTDGQGETDEKTCGNWKERASQSYGARKS
jgi:hypothetical protein